MLANDDELGAWLRRSARLSDGAVKQSIERLHQEEVFTVADLQVLHQIGGFVRVFSPVTAQKVAGALEALEPRTASPAAPHSIAGVRFGGRSLDFEATLDTTRPHAHTPTPWQALSKDQQLQLIASLRAEDATHTPRDASSPPGGLGSSSPVVRFASSPDRGSPVSVIAHGVPETVPLHYRCSGRVVDSPYSGHAPSSTPSLHMPLTPRLQAALRRMSSSPVEAETTTVPEEEEAAGARPAHGPMMAQWSRIRCVATLGLSEIVAALLPPYPLAFGPNCSGWFEEDLKSASHLFGGSLFL